MKILQKNGIFIFFRKFVTIKNRAFGNNIFLPQFFRFRGRDFTPSPPPGYALALHSPRVLPCPSMILGYVLATCNEPRQPKEFRTWVKHPIFPCLNFLFHTSSFTQHCFRFNFKQISFIADKQPTGSSHLVGKFFLLDWIQKRFTNLK